MNMDPRQTVLNKGKQSTTSFLEISPNKRTIQQVDEDTKAVLILKPFAARPLISFKQILINTEITKTLYIYNPDSSERQVEFIKSPTANRHLELSASSLTIPSKFEVPIFLTWRPRDAGSWCDTLNIKDNKGFRGAVSIVFESLAPKKPRATKHSVATQETRRGTGKPNSKPATRPHWKVAQPINPTTCNGAQHSVPEDKQTWRTFGMITNAGFPTIDVPSTPRRETYTVTSKNRIQSSADNKENRAKRTFAAVLQENSTFHVSPFLFNKKREPFSELVSRPNPELLENTQELSPDSLDSSLDKPLENLNTKFLCSPMVHQKVIAEKEGTIFETFIKETIVGTTSFSDTNFSDLSFATRRCSTASKSTDKCTNIENSPNTNKVSPRALHFSPAQDKRLSTGTYVVSAANSLEGVAGDISDLPPASPNALSQVLEVPEKTDELDWTVHVRGNDKKAKIQLATSPAESSFNDSLEIKPLNFRCISDKIELTFTPTVSRPLLFDISPPLLFDISPPHRSIESNLYEKDVHRKFENAAESSNTCVEKRHIDEKKSMPSPTSFQISPPAVQAKFSKEQSQKENRSQSSVLLHISPPKPFALPVDEYRNSDSLTSTKNEDPSLQNKTYDVPQSQDKVGIKVPFELPQKLKCVANHAESEMSITTISCHEENKLHDPDVFLYNFALSNATMPGSKKNPFYLNPLLCEPLLQKYENDFTKWLNSVLTPPEELGTEDTVTVSAADLWARSTRIGAIELLAPSREVVTNRYLSVKSRFDQLRKVAFNLFQEKQMAEVLCAVTARIDSGKLKIRDDKSLHLNQGLKHQVLALFLSFNPLWLRIGLETVVGKIIPVQSNTDYVGLAHFIVHRLLSPEAVVGKSCLLLKKEFKEMFNRFVLKKFLLLVYFLDQAKTRKIIRHDPCLFRKNSEIKASKDLLFTFSRLLLAGEGDITRHLGYLGYKVSHKQGYLDEFRYSVVHLGVDLRDGVRLTRVVELLTGSKELSVKLRVPAVSRLQKIHNVDVALQGLKQAGYEVENVNAADIVAGHREKTLSLLWQILHKFQYPRFEKAAKIIQNWWLHPSLRTKITRRIDAKRRTFAAVTIQKTLRGFLCRKRFEAWKVELQRWKLHHDMAQVIQRNFKRYCLKKKKIKLTQQNTAARVIQHNVRIFLLKQRIKALGVQARLQQTALRESAALKIQCYFKCITAKKQLTNLKDEYKIKLVSAIKIQSFFRGILARRHFFKIKQAFVRKVAAVLILQTAWRCYQARKILESLEQDHKKHCSAVIIQCAWRSFKSRQFLKALQQEVLIQKKLAAITIQCAWRSFKARNQLSLLREDLRRRNIAARNIQSVWRCFAAKMILSHLKQQHRKQLAATTIQCAWRCYIAREAYLQLVQEDMKKKNSAAQIIQCFWRCHTARKLLQTLQKSHLHKQNTAAITIQCAFKCYLARNMVDFLKKDYFMRLQAAETLKRSWHCYKARQMLLLLKRDNEIKRKNAALKIQCTWKCYQAKMTLAMLKKQDYEKKVNACEVIQRAWKCHKARQMFLFLRYNYYTKRNIAALRIQCTWKCYQAKKTLAMLKKQDHENKVNACEVIQRSWKCYKARQMLLLLKRDHETKRNHAALRIQCTWKCYQAKKILAVFKKQDYDRKINACEMIQRAWKCHKARQMLLLLKHDYEIKRNLAALRIQCTWKFYQAKKILAVFKKQDHEKRINACEIIQRAWKCHKARQMLLLLKHNYEIKRNLAALRIQCTWKCYQAKKTLAMLKKQDHENKVNACEVIQRSWKCYKARQMLLLLKRDHETKRNHAALRIQCTWKCYQAKKILAVFKKQDYDRKINACEMIQRAWKCHKARQMLLLLKHNYEIKRNLAALRIQCTWKCYQAKKTLAMLKKQDHEKRVNACEIIQRAWKCHKARQVLLLLKHDNEIKRNLATLKIQCVWRCYQAKLELLHLRQGYAQKLHAATVIQRSWRCFVAKRILLSLKSEFESKRNLAVLKIQCAWRCHVSTSILLQLKHENQKRIVSAINIQCWWRCHLARTILSRLKKENTYQKNIAAVKIQCLWRCFVARQRVKCLQEEKRQKSASKIQGFWRCHVAKLQLQKLKKRHALKLNCSAVIIQYAWRCHKAKRLFHYLQETRQKKLEAIAATCIQNAWRSYKARQLLTQLKCNAKMTQLQLELQHSKAAITIQRAIRRWFRKCALSFLIAQKKNKTVHSSVLNLCKEYLLDQNKDAKDRNKVIFVLRQQKLNLQKLNNAAVVIQKRWRKYFHQKNQAALKIQTLWRGYVCRRNIRHAAEIKKSVSFSLSDGKQKIVIAAEEVVKVAQLHKRIQEATKNAKVEDSIARKLQKALAVLGKSFGHNIYAMYIFDYCLSISEECVALILPRLDHILTLMKANNRSVPSMEEAQYASGAVLSLAKHPISQGVVWKNKHLIPALLTILVASKERPSNETTFNNVCTILWMMTRDPVALKALQKHDGLKYRLQAVARFIHSREQSNQLKRKYENLPMPNLRFNKEPRRFATRLQGLHILMKSLNVPIPKDV